MKYLIVSFHRSGVEAKRGVKRQCLYDSAEETPFLLEFLNTMCHTPAYPDPDAVQDTAL